MVSMPTLRLTLLGEPNARLDGVKLELGFRALLLLCLISLPRDERQAHWSRTELAEWLWPTHKRPLSNLSQELYKLRNTLGQGAFDSDAQILVLLLEHQSDLDEQQQNASSDQPERWLLAWEVFCLPLLAFLEPDWDAQFSPTLQDWFTDIQTALTNTKRELAAKLATQALSLGQYRQAIEYLQYVQPEDSDPREAQATQLMLTFTALDQPERATLVYQRLRQVLQELDSKPSQDALAAFEIARDQQIAAARALLSERYTLRLKDTEMPFVGRQDELSDLEAQLPNSFEGIGWLTLLTGEPGAGKTAFARHVLQHLDPHKRIYWSCEGFGERNAPTWRGFDLICRTLVRRRRAVFDAMPNELRAVLARFLPDVLEPVTYDPQPGDDRLLYAAIRMLLTHDEQPTLLFLDDLHWFDETSLGLVLELLRKPPPRGLLVIATFRDTEVPSNHGAWTRLLEVIQRDKRGQNIALQPLDLEAIRVLAEERKQSADIGWMYAQSGGNPLYLFEMFEANYTEPGRVPQGVEALIQARIDTLPQNSIARDVLEACAVLGESTSLNEVKNVCDFDYDTTVQALGSLRIARLLQANETRIQLHHNLTRDTTLHRMNLERSQLLNLRAARARHERPEQAAIHYWQAMGEGANQLEVDDTDVAVTAFTAAGTNQAFRGDVNGGLQWFDRALQCANTNVTNRVMILTRRAHIHERLLQFDQASSDLRQAEQLSGAVDPITRAGVLNAQGLLMASCFGDAAGCERASKQVLETLDRLEQPEALAERATAFNNLGVAALQRHELETAEHYHHQALKLRTALADMAGIAKSHHNLGLVLTSRGDAIARVHFEKAILLLEQLGNQSGIADVHADMTWLEWQLGSYESAAALCEQMLAARKPWGDDYNLHLIYNNLGAARYLQGHYHAACQAYSSGLSTQHAQKNKHVQAMFQANLAEAQIHLGLFEESHESLERASNLLVETPNSALEAMVHWYRGELFAERRDTVAAYAEYDQASKLAKAAGRYKREAASLSRLARLTGNRDLAALALRLSDAPEIQASVWMTNGDHGRAMAFLTQTGDKYEEMRLASDLSLVTGKSYWSHEAERLRKQLPGI